MSFSIRPALPADEATVIALTPRLADFGPPAFRPASEIATGEARTLRAAFRDMPAGAALRVAADDSAVIVGFIFLETRTDYFTGQSHGHVGILVVSREAEGRGVGHALLDVGDAWARAQGYAYLTLGVFAGNSRARSVYEHAGYFAELLVYRKPLAPRA